MFASSVWDTVIISYVDVWQQLTEHFLNRVYIYEIQHKLTNTSLLNWIAKETFIAATLAWKYKRVKKWQLNPPVEILRPLRTLYPSAKICTTLKKYKDG